MLFFNCRVTFDDSRTIVLFFQMSVRTQPGATAEDCKCRHPNQCGITAILTFFSPTNFHFYCPPATIIHSCQIISHFAHFNFHSISGFFQYWKFRHIAHPAEICFGSPVMWTLYHVQWGKHFHLVFNLTGQWANPTFWTFYSKSSLRNWHLTEHWWNWSCSHRLKKHIQGNKGEASISTGRNQHIKRLRELTPYEPLKDLLFFDVNVHEG